MPTIRETLDLEDLVITVYAALDDALAEAGVVTRDGKLVPRPGPAPDVDDREVLCLAVLQIDSHPVDVCRPVRAGRKERLGGLAQRGYCASLKRWFHGVREHLVFTPGGRSAAAVGTMRRGGGPRFCRITCRVI